MTHSDWLSEDELVFHRMKMFHHERVGRIAETMKASSQHDKGILVVHLIPHQCVISRTRFEGAKLKEHGSCVHPLGSRGGRSRFNVDGFLNYDGYDEIRSYTQVCRDGRIEAVMRGTAYSINFPQGEDVFALRESICEKSVIDLVGAYLVFCKAIGIRPPICMFSSLLNCNGVRMVMDRNWHDLSTHSIDRSPAFLQEIDITEFDQKIDALLRPWCDSLWQASGLDRSFSYDEQGNWHERR